MKKRPSLMDADADARVKGMLHSERTPEPVDALALQRQSAKALKRHGVRKPTPRSLRSSVYLTLEERSLLEQEQFARRAAGRRSREETDFSALIGEAIRTTYGKKR